MGTEAPVDQDTSTQEYSSPWGTSSSTYAAKTWWEVLLRPKMEELTGVDMDEMKRAVPQSWEIRLDAG